MPSDYAPAQLWRRARRLAVEVRRGSRRRGTSGRAGATRLKIHRGSLHTPPRLLSSEVERKRCQEEACPHMNKTQLGFNHTRGRMGGHHWPILTAYSPDTWVCAHANDCDWRTHRARHTHQTHTHTRFINTYICTHFSVTVPFSVQLWKYF